MEIETTSLRRVFVLAVLLAGFVVRPAVAQTPTPTGTPTSTPTALPTVTATPVTPTASAPTGTPSPTATGTVTPTVTATLASPTLPAATVTPSRTEIVTATATGSPSPTGTITVTATVTVPTNTPVPTTTTTFTPTTTPVPSATASPLPTATPVRRPLIFIRSYRTDPAAVVAGNDFWLILELHNVGNDTARNIVVTFASETFVPVGTSSAKTVSRLTPDEHGMVGQNLKASANLQSGTYPQVIKIDYDDLQGNHYSSSETVGVTVIGTAAGRPQPVVERSSTDPPTLFPGGEFNLFLTVRNLGDRRARNILVTLASDGPFAPLGQGNVQRVASLDRDQVVTLMVRLVVDQETRPGAYNQGVTLEYDDLAGNHYTTNQTIGLVVAAHQAERPLLMVLSYDASTGSGQRSGAAELAPGDIFTLNLEIANVGQQRAYRVLISLGGGQTPGGQGVGTTGLGIFAPLESSNVKFIPQLDPGERRSISQRMAVDGGAASGVYVLTVTFTYDDRAGTSYSSSERISLLVIRRALLRIDLFQPVEEVEVGQDFDIPVEVINVGRNTVNVTTVEVASEDLEIHDGTLYIGPLDSGTSGTLEARAVATRVGQARATVTVRYIDDFGREQLVTKELAFRVKQPPLVELPGVTEEGAEQQGLLSRVWRFVLALLGLGG